MAPMGELMTGLLKPRTEYPPAQGAKTFDMSHVLEEFIKNGRQQTIVARPLRRSVPTTSIRIGGAIRRH